MMEYIRKKRGSVAVADRPADQHDGPVLTEEDEIFLRHITSEPEGPAPELPPRPHGETSLTIHATETPAVAAEDVPLPQSPPPTDAPRDKGKGKEKKSPFGFLRRSESKRKSLAADDLGAAAQALKSPTKEGEGAKEDSEDKELEDIMDKLNLAAINNRVFSVSDESRELLRKFTLVLKDLVHGVPTAYGDLESLLTNSEGQLQKTFSSMPSFLQHLVTKLPSKVSEHLGPEIMAAAAEKPGLKAGSVAEGASAAERVGARLRVPSLKELVAKQGAVAGLLRAIVDFLRTRFPAVLGLNVLWSLAVSVLLLVFWYCWKRGREERLEKERALSEAEMEELRKHVAAEPAADYEPPTTTTAPEGATIEEVRLGMEEVARARAAALEGATAASTGPESSRYAPEGSLARSLRLDEEAKAEKEEARAGEEVKKDIEGERAP